MTNTNRPKVRMRASDIKHLQNAVIKEINPIIEDLVFEISVAIAEREFDIFEDSDFEDAENYQFEVVMPVIADMIYAYSKWEL